MNTTSTTKGVATEKAVAAGKRRLSLAIGLLMAGVSLTAPGTVLAQDEAPSAENGHWNLTDLYPSDTAWQKALDQVQGRIDDLGQYQSTLTDDPAALATALDAIRDVEKETNRVATYASLQADEDLRNASAQTRQAEAEQLGANFESAIGYLRPALVAMDSGQLGEWLKDERLRDHRRFLENVIREAPHTLSTQTESALAALGPVMSHETPYSLLANSDIDWPEITIDGKQERLDAAGYSRLRESPDRELRKRVFETYWPAWQQYTGTIGSLLNAQVQQHVTEAHLRHYDSAMAAALSRNDIPTAVYHQLVDSTNAHLDTLHRYLKLRQRILGVDQLHYYDIYPPLAELDHQFDLDDARRLTREATQPLGPHYAELLTKATGSAWTSAYPSQGKRSGAYMNGSAYDVHPYVLMNFNGSYGDVSTYAHEWGHGIHSLLANEAQPFAKSNYSIFTAEVASITNEQLLVDQMIDQAETPKEKLFYIGQALEALRGTFFRQAQFAEFELAIHEAAEKGEQLSGERMTAMYGKILRKYYGVDEGITDIDKTDYVEWAYIPHFYYDFYVYQYATSITAAEVFAHGLRTDPEKWRDDYLNVLSQGGAASGYQLLKMAGVDLATPAPYDSLMQTMNQLIDEAQKTLDEIQA
ncbi:oligoendopeptidase F [Salinicola rhizosphaerae]|uniref:oligoendopeptidase F n=1 Tax=Salinicola rhizosphaerae TaxID=1443141 RepID=UPI0016754572|nr:oligoendopeptidase F [Salinicola rhizosphaerae]